MKNIVKVKERKLKKYEFSGNLLYKNKKTYFFTDKIYNTLFINESENAETENLAKEFENYLVEFFSACSAMKTKPSLLVLSDGLNKEKYIETLGESYVEITTKKHAVLLEKSPSIYFVKDEKYFCELLEKLIEKRTDVFAPNNIYIVIDKPEKYDIKKLVTYLTVTRSRRLHITLFVHDKKAFEKTYSSTDIEFINAHCYLKFTCDNNDVLSIEVNNNQISKK